MTPFPEGGEMSCNRQEETHKFSCPTVQGWQPHQRQLTIFFEKQNGAK